jgi:hypothetical protein
MSGFYRSPGDRLHHVVGTTRKETFRYGSNKLEKKKRESKAYQEMFKLREALLREQQAQTNRISKPNLNNSDVGQTTDGRTMCSNDEDPIDFGSCDCL